jgi:hypothetical protein
MQRWRTSSFSGSSNNCVQVSTHNATVAIRDSKTTDGPALVITRAAWEAFTHAIKTGGLHLARALAKPR